MIYVFYYLVAISFVSIILTIYDKIAAIKHRFRIPEKVLFALGFFGGALLMYITMISIRHKTRHKKFMITLPIFICLHIILIFFIIEKGFIL